MDPQLTVQSPAEADALTIPLIIRGKVYEGDWVTHRARHDQLSFRSPDVGKHLDKLVLRDPGDLSDLYSLSLDEIIDYLVALGERIDAKTNPHIARARQIAASTTNKPAAMLDYTFAALKRAWTRASSEEFIDVSIGRRYLEGWVEDRMLDRTTYTRAFGARGVHVIAGNGQKIALNTLLVNAVSRSDAIIKLPSNDPYFAVAMALSMIDMAPDHPLTRHVSVAYWKGGDASVEKPLYRAKNLEKIVAWGGFDSMRSVRNYLAPGLDLVALDPKSSASIIGRQAFASDEAMQDAATRAAADVGYFNQGGCVSARTLFVDSGTDDAGIEAANRFGKLVFDEIQALPEALSSPAPSFDAVLREEIQGIRYSDDYRIFGGKANEGAVIVSQNSEQVDFSDRLDHRVANIVPVDSLEEALRFITIHTQTIGVYPDGLKEEIRDECARRGGQRICSLGFATAGSFSGVHDGIEPLRRVVRWVKEERLSRRSGALHPD